MAVNSVVVSALGPTPGLAVRNHQNQDRLVNASANPWSPMLATIICAFAPGTVAIYNIEFSNDGVNYVPDANATGLSGPVIYATGAYSLFWRINCTSFTSGSIMAAYGAP